LIIVEAFEGSTLLDSFSGTALSNQQYGGAYFFSIVDITGADITSITVRTSQCAGGQDPSCLEGFAITTGPVQVSVPEKLWSVFNAPAGPTLKTVPQPCEHAVLAPP
jgi:hypothetical protein